MALYRAAGRYEGQLKHDSCDAESSIDRGAERVVTAVASLHFLPPSLVRGVPKTKQRIKCTHELVDWVKHLTN